jgi:glutamyl-tRNA reductase
VAFLPEEIRETLGHFHAHELVSEVALLSTCNRTELYVISEEPSRALALHVELVKNVKKIDLGAHSVTYTHRDRACVEHLFRVAAGIDSMVIGETAILGQVKAAFECARECDALGAIFGKLFTSALRVGKRSRTETGIGRGAVSLEKAGVQLAEKIFGNLARRTTLVIGAGDTGKRVAQLFREAGAKELVFANRTLAKAEELAELHGGRAAGIDSLEREIARADIVVAAVNAREPVVSSETLRSALHERGRRTLLIVDLGVPHNVDPEARRHESVFLYSVDDLEELVRLNLGRRQQEIPAVERIVVEETDRFFEWMSSLETAPVVVAMREAVELLRVDSIEKMKGALSQEERDLLERFSVSFMNRILHGPTLSVRRSDPKTYEGLRQLEWVRQLFRLEDRSVNGEEQAEEEEERNE